MNADEFKEVEPLYTAMAEYAIAEPTISISRLQRNFMIGYNRAARMLEHLVEVGTLKQDRMTGAFSHASTSSEGTKVMAIATIKIHPFTYANFVHLAIDEKIPGQAEGRVALNVGDAFPTDEAAAAFWDELKQGWIMHCRQRRSADNGPDGP